ncbi:MAG: response regulator [Thermodesulfobacteriota bacterium]|nr:response regulator [Thermodesulfobacteriota bacterium]
MHRVLVVDNDAQLLTILKEDLAEHKSRFEIITVEDGLAAIMALKERSFSLVVTEIRIPIVNGLVLLAYIRKNYPKTPCIVMTGHGTPFLRRRLQPDVAHYLEKPFRVAELAQAIRSVLGRGVVFGGIMKGISLPGFLELIEKERITCLCEIMASGVKKGYLLFDGGALYNAFYGGLKGEEAALEVLQMKDVTIRFGKPPERTVPRRIETNLSRLVAKATRAHEETEPGGVKRHAGAAELTDT